MSDSNLIIYLVLATFAIAIGVGIYQLYRVRRAKRLHHHSAKTPGETSQR